MAKELLRVEHLQKKFGNDVILEDVNAVINKGDVIAVIGPSGTGKSTFLRCLNRLEEPTGGKVIFDGEDMGARGCRLNLVRQKMGMVFQSFNLYQHMNVMENLMYAPMKVLGLSREEACQRGRKLLRAVGLEEKELSFPDELSGGQKQRIAIARTLAMQPEVILFDEPTSALDPAMEGEVVAVIRRLAQEGMTMIIVTHNMRLAESVANRVFYMDHGVICEEGTPEEIFEHPAREETRQFINGLSGIHQSFQRDSLDYLGLISQIRGLAIRKLFSPGFVQRIEECLETVCLRTVLPAIGKNTEISFDLMYSEKKKCCEIGFAWQSETAEELPEKPALSDRLEELKASLLAYGCREGKICEIRAVVRE